MSKSKGKTKKCMRRGCAYPRAVRGLCRSCYVSVYRYVKAGKVTWKELEARGKTLPSKKKDFQDWMDE